MSDFNAEDYNISRHFYSEFYQITDHDGGPLTNIYLSYADRNMPVFGTVYLFHGYGGSPVEPCLKIPMLYALSRGFDVAALEGAALSATYSDKKDLSNMNLARQKYAIMRGLWFCSKNDRLCHDNKIAWGHSLSCRALSDMVAEHPFVRQYFGEVILNNPYFITPSRVEKLRNKLIKRDPSGSMWRTLVDKAATMYRIIENQKYSIPTCLRNLAVPLPQAWQYKPENIESLAAKMSDFVTDIRMTFVLGTADDMAEYNQNLKFYNGLKVTNKELISIDGADHSFENAIPQYNQVAHGIIDNIYTRCEKTK